VRGKQVHDCNIVATMRAHGVRRLATRNSGDFERYGTLIDIDAVP
jgi:predicted nucleic acid-binding protein